MQLGFLSGSAGNKISLKHRRHRKCRFDLWVGKILWRAWQPTPVFWIGESDGLSSLMGYNPKGHKESDMTEQLSMHTHVQYKRKKLLTTYYLLSAKVDISYILLPNLLDVIFHVFPQQKSHTLQYLGACPGSFRSWKSDRIWINTTSSQINSGVQKMEIWVAWGIHFLISIRNNICLKKKHRKKLILLENMNEYETLVNVYGN